MTTRQRRLLYLAVLVFFTVLLVLDFVGSMTIIDIDVNPVIITDYSVVESAYPSVEKRFSWEVGAYDITQFTVNNPHGSVQITGYDGEEIEIVSDVTLYATDELAAKRLIDIVSFTHVTEGQNYQVAIDDVNDPDEKGVIVDYYIKVPQALALSVNNSFGSVVVESIDSDVSVEASHSRNVSLSQVTGKVRGALRHSEATISDIAGSLTLDVAHSQLDIQKIQSAVDLEAQHSMVKLVDAEILQADVSHSQLDFSQLARGVTLDGAHSTLQGTDIVGPTRVRARFGSVTLSGLGEQVDIAGSFAPIELHLDATNASYDLRLEVANGRITSNANLEEIQDGEKQVQQGIIGDGDFPLRVRSEYGNIAVRVD